MKKLFMLVTMSMIFTIIYFIPSEAAVPVSGISLTDEEVNLEVGDTYQESYTISPSNATNTDVSWLSSDTDIVTVTTGGSLFAVSSGSAIVTVTTDDGGYTDSMQVIVEPQTTSSSSSSSHHSSDVSWSKVGSSSSSGSSDDSSYASDSDEDTLLDVDDFSDYDADDWYATYVDYALSQGYFGQENSASALDDTLTFAQSLTALDRLLVSHGFEGDMNNSDLVESNYDGDEDSWYTNPVKDVMTYLGDEMSTVDPDEEITRDEMAEIVYLVLDDEIDTDVRVADFLDLFDSDYKYAINWSASTQILEGYNGIVFPESGLTQAEMSAILYRIDSLLDD